MVINWSSREIDVFLVLADTLSFRRTAERVHLSQPAVTGVIGRLEEALNVRLFDRTTRQVQLTGPGQVFLEQAQRLRHMTEEAVRTVREVATLQTGQVARWPWRPCPRWPPRWCHRLLHAFAPSTPGCACGSWTLCRTPHLSWCVQGGWTLR